MKNSYNVLIMGASYGSLLGTKLLLAGHSVTLVCTARTADLINTEGTVVKMRVRGRDELVHIDSKKIDTSLRADVPSEINPKDYDLVVLGMQEPQYGLSGVRELLDNVAKAKVPAMAIMNMPPLPYLARLPGLDVDALLPSFTDPSVWKKFEPGLVTLASPDPQAFRPLGEGKNVLEVSLPTNFKVARFESDAHTDMLKKMQNDIEEIEFSLPDNSTIPLPVKLKVFNSLYVPLAKWSMLITGNYRCIQKKDMVSIRDAVHVDLEESKRVYQWVVDLCVKMGADEADMVPFDKYAAAATGLSKPSSGARAVFNGAANIERVDSLVQAVGQQFGMSLDSLEQTVAFVNAHLIANRAKRNVS